ncbi:MAG TPA: FAD-binding oxidoreductase [Ktedonobacteraceae bacterium]|jgi:sarcosine oxidase subunit beta|nr:FAD-binding oxidoreductase [Ktedonobacteraceae bacterium]
MIETTDILIIGGGVMGASIAYHLAKSGGGRVMLLERQAICSGTTGRSGAIVRQHYSNDFTIRMAKESLAVFQHFDEVVGGDAGFLTTGMVVLADEQGVEALRANVQMQQEQGVNTMLLEPEEIGEMAPGYSSKGVVLGCYEPETGVADPMATTSCFASRARDYGALIREGEPVTGILTQHDRVQGVRTTQGEVYAPVVVLAANVWSVALAKTIGIDLPVMATRHPMVALRRPNDFGGRQGLHAVGLDLTRDIYLRPDIGGITLVGATENVFTASDPDNYAQGLTEEEIAYFRAQSAESIPALERAVPRGGWAGIYDDTPDFHPILDHMAAYEGLYCAVGFSGHGFKLSPVVGQWMAQYILTGQKTADMQHFAFDRFARGMEISPRYPSGVLG